ncbi:MAG: nickel-dependent lactate racemase [Fastidiosipilaceae bacterium]|jgi:nickel-dependent lactate racemase
MNIELNYAKTKLSLEVADQNLVGVLLPNEVKVDLTGAAEVKRSLENPISSPRLKDIVKPGESVCLITSDITRPIPSYTVLPPVLDELNACGVKDEDIFIVFGLGSHRHQTEEEMRRLVGDEIFDRIRCMDSDPEGKNVTHLGETSNGTVVDIFTPVVEADRVICLGNVEFHYFAGYSGGGKAIMPGVATHDSIQSNHRMMVLPEAIAGKIEGNPIREEMDDITKYVNIDFIVNVVLNEKKEIIYSAAGHYIDAHREACKYLDQLYKKELDKACDIVIVSPGGYPKDINVYQAQKALDNAKNAVRDGGIIIWTAACSEGLGEPHFEEWMLNYTPDEMVKKIKETFVLGGHKAAAISMVLQRCRVILVSDLEQDFVEKINLEYAPDLETAYQRALKDLGDDASVLIMPYGGSTLPSIKA